MKSLRYFPRLLVVLVVATQANHREKRDYLDLNKCFSYRKGWEVVLKANEITASSSVAFKDDCLRACLRTLLQDGLNNSTACKAVLHLPKDNDCFLSARVGRTVALDRMKKVPAHYFENLCAKPRKGGRLSAQLRGFRGGQGLVELAQRRGKNPYVMVVLDGLAPNKLYDVVFSDSVPLQRCFSVTGREAREGAQHLATVDTDRSGMGVQPWTELDWHILDDSVLDKTVLLLEHDNNSTGAVVDCGALKVKNGNLTHWEAAKRSASSASMSAAVLLPFLLALAF